MTVVRAKLNCGLRFGSCLFQTAEDKGVAGIVVLGLEEPRIEAEGGFEGFSGLAVAAVERDGEAGATLRAISSWMAKTSPGSQSKTPDQSW